MRSSVVLPAPLGPTRPIFSPLLRAAAASMKRIWWPFCLLMLSRRIMRCGWFLFQVDAHLPHMASERKPCGQKPSGVTVTHSPLARRSAAGASERRKLGAGPRIPDLEGAVEAARVDPAAIGREGR